MIVKNVMRLFQVGLTRDERKVIFIASLGSMLDFYDFIISYKGKVREATLFRVGINF